MQDGERQTITHLAAIAGRNLLALLAEREVRWPTLPPPSALVDEEDRRWRLAATVAAHHQQTLARRVQSVRALDQAAVVMPDGSHLDLDQAERLLTAKEEDRVYQPLRGPMERVQASFLRFHDDRSVFRRDDDRAGHPAAASTASEDEDEDEDARGWAAAFLRHTDDVVPLALELLGSAGRVAIEDDPSLRRALDLPAPALFNDARLVDVGRAVRDAQNRDAAGSVWKRVRAPRALAGWVVVDDDEGSVRWFVCPSARLGRFRRLAWGLGSALAVGLVKDKETSAGKENGAAGKEAAAALALLDEDAWRRTGASPRDARWATRVGRAAGLLHARLQASLMLVGGNDPDELRERGQKALGLDVGAAFLDEAWPAPWPDGRRLHTLQSATAQEGLRQGHAASAWLWARDAWDEGFLFRSDFWRTALDNPPARTADQLGRAGETDAAGWITFLSEVS